MAATVARPAPHPAASAEGRRRRQVRVAPARQRRRPTVGLLAGAVIVGVLVLLAVVGPAVIPADPTDQDLIGRLAPPVGFGGTWTHPLGTDALGRDLLARVAVGARTSLLIGLAATAGAGMFGVALGLLSGWLPGPVDAAVAWLTDVQATLPFVVVAIAATAALGNGFATVLLTLVVTGWVAYARVVRVQVQTLRAAAWVEAAAALGGSPVWVLRRHVAPHLAATVAVLASQQVAAMILYEASLSFLGLGIGGDAITWGGMAAAGREALLSAWWVPAIPGGMVALTVLGFSLLGDAVASGRGR